MTYKNPLDFAKFTISDAANVYSSTDNKIQCAPIDYKVVYNNEEEPDYSIPTFYTDCSDAITLGFLNKNVVSHYSVPDNNNVAFNGSLLRQANIDLASLTTAVNFRILITNNLNQDFIYNVKLNLTFNEESGITTNGYSYQGKQASEGKEYNFFKDI